LKSKLYKKHWYLTVSRRVFVLCDGQRDDEHGL